MTMKLILEVERNKAELLLEFLRSLPYVKVTAETKMTEERSLADELEEAVAELKLVRSGKKKARTLTEFLDDV